MFSVVSLPVRGCTVNVCEVLKTRRPDLVHAMRFPHLHLKPIESINVAECPNVHVRASNDELLLY